MTESDQMRIPMRVLTRQGHHNQESISLVFEICHLAILFFENIFGHPYPFTKLDLVLVPLVRYSAMECAACVVFGESMMASMPMEQLSQSKVADNAIMIMHEISHQWFGNMVTMRWWNDLWLNESFATIISHFAH